MRGTVGVNPILYQVQDATPPSQPQEGMRLEQFSEARIRAFH